MMRVSKLRNELNPYEVFIDALQDHVSLKKLCEFVLENYCKEEPQAWRDTAPTLIFAKKLLVDILKTQNYQ
jgi:hypothetical protein